MQLEEFKIYQLSKLGLKNFNNLSRKEKEISWINLSSKGKKKYLY